MKNTESKKAYDLTAAELENSSLAWLASQAGYASLRGMLNDLSMWSLDLVEVETFLRAQLSQPTE